jgi:hypothetical protein
MRRAIALVTFTMIAMVPLGAAAQWQGYKTPNIPRTADGKANLTAPAPKTADGKPDLNGIWLASRAVFDLRQTRKPGDPIPFTPEGKAVFDQRQATLSKDDPSALCLPTGLPVRALLRTPFKIVQGPGTTAILYESGTRFRQVLTDGRPLPDVVDWPAWQGFSIGRWMTITERFRRRDFGHMDMEMIIDDRKMYTRPWSIHAEFVLQTDTELLEFICEENNAIRRESR